MGKLVPKGKQLTVLETTGEKIKNLKKSWVLTKALDKLKYKILNWGESSIFARGKPTYSRAGVSQVFLTGPEREGVGLMGH